MLSLSPSRNVDSEKMFISSIYLLTIVSEKKLETERKKERERHSWQTKKKKTEGEKGSLTNGPSIFLGSEE